MMLFAQERPFFDWDWVGRNLDEIAARTWEHIYLTAVPVAIGLVIALGLSVIALRWRRTYAPITLFTGIL